VNISLVIFPALMDSLLHGSINARVCCLSIARAIRKNFSSLVLLTAVGEIKGEMFLVRKTMFFALINVYSTFCRVGNKKKSEQSARNISTG